MRSGGKLYKKKHDPAKVQFLLFVGFLFVDFLFVGFLFVGFLFVVFLFAGFLFVVCWFPVCWFPVFRVGSLVCWLPVCWFPVCWFPVCYTLVSCLQDWFLGQQVERTEVWLQLRDTRAEQSSGGASKRFSGISLQGTPPRITRLILFHIIE